MEPNSYEQLTYVIVSVPGALVSHIILGGQLFVKCTNIGQLRTL